MQQGLDVGFRALTASRAEKPFWTGECHYLLAMGYPTARASTTLLLVRARSLVTKRSCAEWLLQHRHEPGKLCSCFKSYPGTGKDRLPARTSMIEVDWSLEITTMAT